MRCGLISANVTRMALISSDELKRLLRYEPETGLFYWRVATNNRSEAGKVAGYKARTGYILIGVGNRRYLAHRLAFFFSHGKWPKITDHINRKRDDNRICNLREVTAHVSNINKRPHKKAVSGKRGVVINEACPKRPYRATAKDETGRQVHLGYFTTADEAHAAYVSYYRNRGITIL